MHDIETKREIAGYSLTKKRAISGYGEEVQGN
jgi:hypothetical protein